MTILDRRLSHLEAAHLRGASRGIEKESLRVGPDGRIALTPHPESLGSALTHPWITTDFSEAMLELVTPPVATNEACLDFLTELHQFVIEHIDGELLWVASMPCFLGPENEIPIARFGSSHSGVMREVYRRGLSLRYGRAMEIITGVHFNFSPSAGFWPGLRRADGSDVSDRQLRDEAFFALMRNYRRWGWLILYLFGASPAVCHTFFGKRATSLSELLPGTHFGELATTLRMSDVGYRNRRQAGLTPSMNCLESYLETLERAVKTPDPEYERHGTEVNGEWRQLSTNLLQIENELYGFVRPKQPVIRGERPLAALRERGVAYVEIRALDVDPFNAVGVDLDELAFMEAFLWFCLLSESPFMDDDAIAGCDAHHSVVAEKGRDPELTLAGTLFRARADEIFERMAPVCVALDQATGGQSYTTSLETQRAKVENPALTPSARLLALIRERGSSFFEVALELSRSNREHLLGLTLDNERRALLDTTAESSLAEQHELERKQTGTFAEYVRCYFGRA